MNSAPNQSGGWTSPQVAMVVLAVVGMFVAGLLAFQRDDSAELKGAITASRLIDQSHEGRISRLEAHVEELREKGRDRR